MSPPGRWHRRNMVPVARIMLSAVRRVENCRQFSTQSHMNRSGAPAGIGHDHKSRAMNRKLSERVHDCSRKSCTVAESLRLTDFTVTTDEMR